MQKKRILIANDASYLGTGYGVYGRELLSRLYKTDKYEIAELACYATTADKARWSAFPWKVYPNAPDRNSEDEKKEVDTYSQNPSYNFGAWRFDAVCCHFKPDIVFDMRDYWMYSFQETCMLRSYYKWVVMPTVDSAPQKTEWLYTFSNMDLVIPYTKWAKTTLQNQCGNTINLFPKIANAGVDLNEFRPAQDKSHNKSYFLGREDMIVIGAVMRNQKRKLFPDIFLAFRKYLDRLDAEGHSDIYDRTCLFLHTSYPEQVGWDFPGLLLEHGIIDKVYFTNICLACKHVNASKFHDRATKCTKCGKESCFIPNANNTITTQDLVKVYQTFDLFLQIAICEGFGMPQAEAAACGVPIASVDYSAMTEIVRNLEGYPVPVKTLFREMETGANRAHPDTDALADIMYRHQFKDDAEKIKMGRRTRELCEKYYSWDQVAQVWDEALDSVDISTNRDWNLPLEFNPQKEVPGGLNGVELIRFILNEVIQEPKLLETAPINKLIKDLSVGYSADSKRPVPVNTASVIKTLEGYMRRKAGLEHLRSSNFKDPTFSTRFLNVG